MLIGRINIGRRGRTREWGLFSFWAVRAGRHACSIILNVIMVTLCIVIAVVMLCMS